MKKLITLIIVVFQFAINSLFAIGYNGDNTEKKGILLDPPCETYITGPTTWCINNIGYINLTGYVNPDCNSTWNVLAGSGTLNLTGGGSSATYAPSPLDAGTTVKITLNNDGMYCTASGGVITAEIDIVINALPSPPSLISGPQSPCQGMVGIGYNVSSISAATGYVWSLPTGATIATGANTNSVQVNYSTSAISGNMSVYGTNGCGNGPVSAILPITVSPLPGAAGSITGSNSVCQGQNSVTYSVPSITNAISYDWTLPVGATITAGANTNNITVNFSGTASGGGVSVSGVNGCGHGVGTALPISVGPLPVAAGSITGTSSLCAGTNSVSYTVPSILNATGYNWTLPSGASIATGSNTNSITVNFTTNALSGNVTVNGTNSCGNGVSSTKVITVNPLPVISVSASGLASVCQGQNGVSYTVTAITNATGYSWSLPTGASIASGSNTNSIVVNYSNTASSGAVMVYGTNACGSGSSSSSLPITVNPLPSASGSITGTASVCKGQAGVVYSVGSILNATGYNWTLPTGASIASGSNTNSITVNYAASATSGNVSVLATNSCGSGTASTAFAVTVHALPVVTASASVIKVCSGNPVTLTGGGATTYTWLPSGVNNGVSFTPAATTTYTVTGTDGFGCSNTATKTINVITPVTPSICMVTVDSLSINNEIYWDKTQYTAVDSFIVYRYDVISTNYLRIGAVSKNSLSMFTDTARNIGGPNGGDPQYASYQYKLAIRDSCGNLSAKSPYHQSIFVQQSNQNFSWNAYTVEGGATPVTGYQFIRNNTGTGTWTVLVNTPGLATTDPNYALYPNGKWRVQALGISCSPTRASINTTRSNIKHTSIATGLNQSDLNASTLLYPNPANNEITIELSEVIQNATIKIMNAIGQIVYEETINSAGNSKTLKNIDISGYTKGIYTVSIENKGVKAIKKLVIN